MPLKFCVILYFLLVALIFLSKLNSNAFFWSFLPFQINSNTIIFFRWFCIFVQHNLLLKYQLLYNWWMQTQSIWVVDCGMLTFFFFFHNRIISPISLFCSLSFVKKFLITFKYVLFLGSIHRPNLIKFNNARRLLNINNHTTYFRVWGTFSFAPNTVNYPFDTQNLGICYFLGELVFSFSSTVDALLSLL